MKKNKVYLINSIRDYILKCPFIDNLSGLGVDFLSNDTNTYSIEPQPVKSLISMHVDGSSERQFVFVFATTFNYSEEIKQNIENSGFFEDFREWIEENNENEVFPILEKGKTPTEIEVMTDGYLYNVANNMKSARYQIQMKLLYDQEPRGSFYLERR